MNSKQNKLSTEQEKAVKIAIGKFAKVLTKKGIDIDDARQEARIAVWQAHERFDSSQGTYESWMIQQAIFAVRKLIDRNGMLNGTIETMKKAEISTIDVDSPGVFRKLRASNNPESDYRAKQIIERIPEKYAPMLSLLNEGQQKTQISRAIGKKIFHIDRDIAAVRDFVSKHS